MNPIIENASFRDRDGFVFYKDDQVYRAINLAYKVNFEKLIHSDFYKALLEENKIVPFEKEVDLSILGDTSGLYKIFTVPKLPFISYPFEWTFLQLKKAALFTLEIQKKALLNGFSLKDASAYNIQFIGNQPVFIDTLSFETYIDNKPWTAYKQFCQHFLGPLLLAHYGKEEMQKYFLLNIDGLPLPVCAKLLPLRSKFNLLAYTHIHLHAKFEGRYSTQTSLKSKALNISKKRVLALIEHLEQGLRGLKIKTEKSNWTGYYQDFSYNSAAFQIKKEFVERYCIENKGKLCVDLGANTGEFSSLTAAYFEQVIACDHDPEVLKLIQKKKTKNILPLLIDLSNPGPAYGWNNSERKSFLERMKHNDLCLALALIHHLCIGNNVPLKSLAHFFSGISKNLIIEFVPKSDSQVKKLLVTKKDIFEDYTLENFKHFFSEYFSIQSEQKLPDSERVLFFLQIKKHD